MASNKIRFIKTTKTKYDALGGDVDLNAIYAVDDGTKRRLYIGEKLVTDGYLKIDGDAANSLKLGGQLPVYYAKATDVTNKSAWDTAVGWGNHASAGYIKNTYKINSKTLSGNSISLNASDIFLSDGITTVEGAINITQNNIPSIPGIIPLEEGKKGSATTQRTITAARLKDLILHHALASNHDASGVTTTKISHWDAAYSWGNHASAGYAVLSSSEVDRLQKTINGTYNLPYYYKLTIYGDSDKYYPVHIGGGNQDLLRTIKIWRRYSEQGPDDWNTSTHKGSLNFVWQGNFGSWGGASYQEWIYENSSQYTTLLGGTEKVDRSYGMAFFLRGGGSGGAVYHIASDQPLTNNVSNLQYDKPTPFYNREITFISGTTYADPAPAPKTAVNTEQIRKITVLKGAQADDRYLNATNLTTGTIPAARIGSGAITAARLASNAVTTAKILNANVTADKLANNSVTTVKIANSNVTTEKIDSEAVTTMKIADLNVTSEKLAANAVIEGKIATDAVTTNKIKNLNVTTDKLANKSVTTAKIASGAVTTEKIADGNVTKAKLAANSGVIVESNWASETQTLTIEVL